MATHRGIRIHQYPDDWLVRATSHQVCLQHTQELVKVCRELGWLVNLDKSELETQTNFRFCRLPVRPQSRSGPTDTGPVAESTGQNTGNIVSKGLSGSAVHVVDRFTNGCRKTGSPRSFTHETYTMALQKQLADTGITGKSDSYSHLPPPSFTMVAE